LNAGQPVRYGRLLARHQRGGHKPVKMADLRAAFEGMGVHKVKTVLASGNVVFEAPPGRACPGMASA